MIASRFHSLPAMRGRPSAKRGEASAPSMKGILYLSLAPGQHVD